MKKRSIVAIAIALILGLALAVLPLATQAAKTDVPSANPVSVWDGTSKSTSLSTDGSGAFLIQSAADLAYFVSSSQTDNYAGKTIKLTTNIRWNDTANQDTWTNATTGLNGWEGASPWSAAFQGTFDGQGHTIEGIYMVPSSPSTDNWGIFRAVSNNAVIKNLNFSKCGIYAPNYTSNVGYNYNMGGLVGSVSYGTPTIENCIVDVDVIAPGRARI